MSVFSNQKMQWLQQLAAGDVNIVIENIKVCIARLDIMKFITICLLSYLFTNSLRVITQFIQQCCLQLALKHNGFILHYNMYYFLFTLEEPC